MTYCNADNCKYYLGVYFVGIEIGSVSIEGKTVGTCNSDSITLRVDNDTDDMTCKTFEYKKKEK